MWLTARRETGINIQVGTKLTFGNSDSNKHETNRLTFNKNIINYTKAQRLAWFGHVHRMPDNSMVKKSI
jgi:hypothetical protein